MITVKPGDKVNVNTSWGQYHVGHAPEGGRTVNGGPIHPPFAFLFPAGIVITADRRPSGFETAPTIKLGEEFIIEGYGVHVLKQEHRWLNDDVECIRVSDGFSSHQK